MQTHCHDACCCDSLLMQAAALSAQFTMRCSMKCVCDSVAYKEEQEALPAPAEARRSAQPSRRRQAAQRRSSPTPPWQAGLLGGRLQAGRVLASAALVEAGRQHRLQELLLRKSLEDQLLEALLASSADHHHECLVATHQINQLFNSHVPQAQVWLH